MNPCPLALALTMTPPGVEKISPKDRDHWLAMRGQDVTASNIAALFGEYEHFGRRGLYERKVGITPPEDESWQMELGSFLEPKAIAKLAAKHPDWKIKPSANSIYFRDPAARVGATPDAFAIRPDRPGFGVIQIKTAGEFVAEKKWLDAAGEAYCPTWVGMQAMTEAMLTGASWAYVATLFVSSGRVVEVEAPIMPDLWAAMKEAVSDFWRAVDSGTPPDPDPIRDGKIIARLFADDDGSQIDLSANNRLPELLARRDELAPAIAAGNAADKERKAIDVELISILGTAQSGIAADGRVFSAKTVKRKGYEVAPTSYRTIKVSAPRDGGGYQPAASAGFSGEF